jgi:uncharacterized protein YgiM (DUF1202 family)
MINKIIKWASLGFLLLNSVIVPAWAYECGVVITQKHPLNIRENPNQRAKLIGSAVRGSALRILETDNTWYKVKLNNGKIGYGSRDYIKKLSSKSREKCGIVITKKSPLNIRLEPSIRSQIIAVASKDSALRIGQRVKKWYSVMLNHTDQQGDIILGFAMGDFVSILNDD